MATPLDPHSPPAAHVRGTGTYLRQATPGPRLGATIVDGALAVGVFFLAHRGLKLSPIPGPGWIVAMLLVAGVAWGAQRARLGRTLGDALWRLKSERPGIREPLLMPARITGQEIARAAFLTLLSVVFCAWSIDQAVFKQPIWARAEPLELDAYLPDMGSGRWEVLPFFYSLGAWPRTYGQRPVFYALPYEKGPPTRFVGHVIARWEAPDTRVTFEGPKTPQAPVARSGERTPRDRIRQCLLGESHSWECLRIRDATLMRHLNEMQRALAGEAGGSTALKMKWRLRWFRVRNAAIPPAEQAQGIYLSAEDGNRGEERYVLVTENGTHQSIALNYPNPDTQEAQTARNVFGESIRSLRASDDLNPGRAWVDRQLESVKLGSLTPSDAGGIPSDPQAVPRLARVQSLLLAKISVQPAVYASYFHLGGTALLLNRISRQGSPAGTLASLELSAVARPMIQNAYRYAQDIAPQDPKTTQLHGFWLESQKR